MFSLHKGWTKLPNNPVLEIQTLACITTDQKILFARRRPMLLFEFDALLLTLKMKAPHCEPLLQSPERHKNKVSPKGFILCGQLLFHDIA